MEKGRDRDCARQCYLSIISALKMLRQENHKLEASLDCLFYYYYFIELPSAGICGSDPSLLGCLAPSPKQWGWRGRVSQDRIGALPQDSP